MAWKVSGVALKWKEFQAMLPSLSLRQEDQAPLLVTNRPGISGFSWCSREKIDPFQAPVNSILNYLSILFDEGLEYRTINCHCSAISAYHAIVDGKPVGQNPRVCALLSGVFNQRPPQPRYTFVWDVEVVLRYIKSLEKNRILSIIDLSYKLTGLLALSAALRVSAIQHLNIDFMARSESSYTFYFNKLHKSWKRGKSPPTVTYQAYPQDTDLCVVKTLDEYIDRTKGWRSTKDFSQLLLSTTAPHKPVVSSTISGWLKKLLARAGIDTSVFKAHSTRSASSSKANLGGAPITEILKRGSWSSESTWQKFYNKNIVKKGELFQEKVYQV